MQKNFTLSVLNIIQPIVNQLCDKNLIDLEVEYKRGLVCFILGIGV